jgi:hypothetical protein
MVTVGCAPLGALSASAGEPPHTAPPRQAEAVQLTGPQLEALLRGGRRFRELPVSDYGPVTRLEYFDAGGGYNGCADRGVVDGRYEVREGRLCIKYNPTRTQCRIISVAPSGGYEQQLIGQDGMVAHNRAVEISPIPQGQSCFAQGAK